MTGSPDLGNANRSEVEYWNSDTGYRWVTYQSAIDAAFTQVTDRLIERAAVQPGERGLDIGCGAGALTLRLAAEPGATGAVLAVDVARALLELAQKRAADRNLSHVDFVLADAQNHRFQAGAFDLLISRFGVMFFSDPVAAFRNMARALRPGGRICFVAWSALEDNPWFKFPQDAAISRLGAPEPPLPRAAGPFAFSEADYVAEILSDAGLSGVSVETEQLYLTFSGTLDDVADLACNLGPAVRILKEKGASEADIEAIRANIYAAFREYAGPDGVRIPAIFNFARATRD